jgi:dolichyl-phosphate beta-glucosyltransferase
LSTPLSAISDFVRFADTRPDIHMVYGARVKLLGRVVQRRALRHYFGRVLATAISVVLRLGVYDTQCGAKLFRLGPATRGLFERPFLSRWLFDVEILARWIQASKRGEVAPVRSVVYEYPLEQWIHRSGSKLRATDALGALVDLVRIGQTYLWR